MPAISATLITHNEAANIARAIRSLAPADEIVLVDSGSTDGTCEIASDLGARVVRHPWEGYARQKNFAASEAKHDWILSLDGDEEFDDVSQRAIERWKSPTPDCAGYRFARCARYLGRWIRHSGWYPDYKVRLYHRRRGRWQGEYVHESVKVEGRVETMRGTILHYTCDSLEDHRRRIEVYTDLAAAEMAARGAPLNPLRRLTAPSWAFGRAYLLHLGFLDGTPGFWIARMASRYVARKHVKWEDLLKAAKVSSGTK
ncbi:MAG: glycosyltransferase family 2 protein [Terriglobia bacterium]